MINWNKLASYFIEYRNGDTENTRVLFESLSSLLKRFIFFKGVANNDIDDLLQQSLLKIHANRDMFDESQSFKAWIYKVSQNLIIDNWRKSDKYKSHIESIVLEEENAEDNLADTSISHTERAELKDNIQFVTRGLKESEKDLIYLYLYEQFTMIEIAQMNSLSLSAAKVKVHRIIKKIRIKNECD